MSRGQKRLDRAIAVVSAHLGRFEMIEMAVLATVRSPQQSAVLSWVERFMGTTLAPRRPVVITNQRVLLPRAYAEGDDWVDVSLDRRQVRVVREEKYGRVATLDVTTALGRQVISTSSVEDAGRLHRALGGS